MDRTDLLQKKQFRSSELREISGATQHQLRYWARIGLVVPTMGFSEGKQGKPFIYTPAEALRVCAIVDALEEHSLQSITDYYLRTPDRDPDGGLIPELEEKILSRAIDQLTPRYADLVWNPTGRCVA